MTPDELKQAGFEQSEIDDHLSQEREILLGAGFSDEEVNAHFAPRPPIGLSVAEKDRISGAIVDLADQTGLPDEMVADNFSNITQVFSEPWEPEKPDPAKMEAVMLGQVAGRKQAMAPFGPPPVIFGAQLRRPVAPVGLRTIAQMERLEQFYKEHPEMKPRQFKGFFDELWRATVGGSINVGAGLMGTLASVSQDAIWDKDQIEEWATKLHQVSRRGAFTAAERGGLSGFVASSVGQAAPFMGASITASVLTGTPTAAFGVAYAVEGDNAYRDALAAGASEGQAQMDRFIVGTINGAIERMQIRGIMRFAETGEAGLRNILSAGRKKAWQKLGKEGVKFSYEAVTHAINEGLEEALQESTAIITVTKYEPIPLGEAAIQVGRAGLGGGVMGLVYGGGGRLMTNLRKRGLDVEFETIRDNLADVIVAETGIKEEAAEQIATDAVVEKFYPTEEPPTEQPTPFIQEIFEPEAEAPAEELIIEEPTGEEIDRQISAIEDKILLARGGEELLNIQTRASREELTDLEYLHRLRQIKVPEKPAVEGAAKPTLTERVIEKMVPKEAARPAEAERRQPLYPPGYLITEAGQLGPRILEKGAEAKPTVEHRDLYRQLTELAETAEIDSAEYTRLKDIVDDYVSAARLKASGEKLTKDQQAETERAPTLEQVQSELTKAAVSDEAFMEEKRAELERLKAIRFKTASDETNVKRIEKQLKENVSKWQAGQGVGWRVTKGQVNRGLRIVEAYPQTHQAKIQFVADTGKLADIEIGRTQVVDTIDLIRDKKFDGAIPTEKPAAPIEEPEITYEQLARKWGEDVVTDAQETLSDENEAYQDIEDRFIELDTANKGHTPEAKQLDAQLVRMLDSYLTAQAIEKIVPKEAEPTEEEAEIPAGWTIQEVAGKYDIYRPDGKLWGTRPTEEAAVKYAQVAAKTLAGEPEIRDLSDKTRRRETKKAEQEIRQHDLYRNEIEAAGYVAQLLGGGPYLVSKTEIEDIRPLIGKVGTKGYNAALAGQFTTDPAVSKLSWDQALAQAAQRAVDDGLPAEDLAKLDISQFAELVSSAMGTAGISEAAMDKAVAGDPYLELLAMKREMLKQGLSATQINDTIRERLSDLGLTEDVFADDFVPVERVEVVEKPKVSKKAKAKATAEEAAIRRAKEVAHKSGRTMYVFEKEAGLFKVSKYPPRTGLFTKIVPPKAGEVKAIVTQEKTGLTPDQLTDEMTQRRNKVIAKVHVIARNKGLISEKGKPKPGYRFLANSMTGKKTAANMALEELERFAAALDALTVGRSGVAKVPTSGHIITKELADRIGEFGEIGRVEHYREARRVFQKIGLEREVFWPAQEATTNVADEIIKFRNEANEQIKRVGRGKETARKLFRAIENPGSVKLTAKEETVVKWAREFFDTWADRLDLTAEQRRQNYVTHIFEAEISQLLKEKHPLDPDLIRSLEFITPKTVFNPFLQERLGRTAGLKEDLWAAMEAYQARALKKFYYEPLIQRIRVYEKFLPPNSARYLRDFITRITQRPTIVDREINQTLKEAAGYIKDLPGGAELAKSLSRGNAAGMIAYRMTGIMYEAWLGLRPLSAIKNLSQHGLILCETGPRAFGQALRTKGQQREDLLKQSVVLRGRSLGYLPGVDETFIRQLENKRRKITTGLFRMADHLNVADAFLAGYWEGKNLGLPDDFAFRRGDEVAADTQYLYNRLAGARFRQTPAGRVLGVLTTWPSNWVELMWQWGRGKQSAIISEYQQQTGQRLTPQAWAAKHKSAILYLGLVSLAMLGHHRTRFKALYYTGWTSIKSLHDIASGNWPGFEIPGIITGLVSGIMLGDMRQIKTNWKKVSNFIVIKKELMDILTGEKDWLNLFLVMEKPKQPKRRIVRRKATRRKAG